MSIVISVLASCFTVCLSLLLYLCLPQSHCLSLLSIIYLFISLFLEAFLSSPLLIFHFPEVKQNYVKAKKKRKPNSFDSSTQGNLLHYYIAPNAKSNKKRIPNTKWNSQTPPHHPNKPKKILLCPFGRCVVQINLPSQFYRKIFVILYQKKNEKRILQ